MLSALIYSAIYSAKSRAGNRISNIGYMSTRICEATSALQLAPSITRMNLKICFHRICGGQRLFLVPTGGFVPFAILDSMQCQSYWFGALVDTSDIRVMVTTRKSSALDSR